MGRAAFRFGASTRAPSRSKAGLDRAATTASAFASRSNAVTEIYDALASDARTTAHRHLLIELDGTPNKTAWGATPPRVSLAVPRLRPVRPRCALNTSAGLARVLPVPM